MIIQIRGTSGSGKSTIVKSIMDLYPPCGVKPVMRVGRKRPICYRLDHLEKEEPQLAVIGHYGTKCGGCDTISTPGQSYPIIFELIRRNAEEGRNVLFEGLLISGDVKWSSKLNDLDFLIIELTTSLKDCLDSVNKRRMIRMEGAYTPVNPANTEAKHKLIGRGCDKLNQEFGIKVERHDREAALVRVRELLNV